MSAPPIVSVRWTEAMPPHRSRGEGWPSGSRRVRTECPASPLPAFRNIRQLAWLARPDDGNRPIRAC
jgi:hypothetical protein